MNPSRTHVVLIPTYNAGPALLRTVTAALAHWQPVWVVADGSTDGSDDAAEALAASHAGLRVLRLATNSGKGAAVLAGAERALAEGFTHALVLDSDGQHPTDSIPSFMAASLAEPAALVLGRPVFGADAPLVRLRGRKLSVALARFEIGGAGIDDPLFGFRVYPLRSLLATLAHSPWGRGYDFDHEAAVRLFWAGVPTRNLPAACRYLRPDEGGVSHFHYVRDNLRLIWLNTRLITEFVLWRWFVVWRIRRACSR